MRIVGIPGGELVVPWLTTFGDALGPDAECEWVDRHGRRVLLVSSHEHWARSRYPGRARHAQGLRPSYAPFARAGDDGGRGCSVNARTPRGKGRSPFKTGSRRLVSRRIALQGLAIVTVLVAAGSSAAVAATPIAPPTSGPPLDITSLCGPGSPPIPDLADVPTDPKARSASGEPIDGSSGKSPKTHDAPELEVLLPDVIDGLAAGKYSQVRPFEGIGDGSFQKRSLLESAGLERSVERWATADYGPLEFVMVSRIDGIPPERVLPTTRSPLWMSSLVPCGIWQLDDAEILVYGSEGSGSDDDLMRIVMAQWLDDDATYWAATDSFDGMARLLRGFRSGRT